MIKAEQFFKYRLRLSKGKDSITHHEARKMLQEALSACGLECALSKGRPRLSLGPGAGEGEASLCEYADICLTREADVLAVEKSLAPFVKGGFKIESIKEVPYMLGSVEALAQYAAYNIRGIAGGVAKAAGCARAEYEVIHENGLREIKNIKPFIYSIKEVNGCEVEIIIKLDVLRSLGMRQILGTLPGLEVDERKLEIQRRALLWRSPGTGALEAV